MNKFDSEINNILAMKIIKAKKKIKQKYKKAKRNKANNSDSSTSATSPALQTGINKDIADTPMPLSIGV